MKALAIFLALSAFIGIDNGAGAAEMAPPKRDIDVLLKAANLPTSYWHKDVAFGGMTRNGRERWIVTGVSKPNRGNENACVASAKIWVLTRDKTGKVALSNGTEPNPQALSFQNFDPNRRETSCDGIDFKEYFSVDDGISTHQAETIAEQLRNAVACVSKGSASCGIWAKLSVDPSVKDDFLKLPGLQLKMMEWADPEDQPGDLIDVRYLLKAPDKIGEFPTYLDCTVGLKSDGSMQLDVGVGAPDP